MIFPILLVLGIFYYPYL